MFNNPLLKNSIPLPESLGRGVSIPVGRSMVAKIRLEFLYESRPVPGSDSCSSLLPPRGGFCPAGFGLTASSLRFSRKLRANHRLLSELL